MTSKTIFHFEVVAMNESKNVNHQEVSHKRSIVRQANRRSKQLKNCLISRSHNWDLMRQVCEAEE